MPVTISSNFARTVVVLIALAVSSNVCAELAVPTLTGRVNDNAGMLTGEQKLKLDELLAAHERETSNQVVVLTIATLAGESLEPFANRVVNTWGVGQDGKDNGVLLLLTRQEGRIRIEVGYGLEGDLTDVEAYNIISKQIEPMMGAGQHGAGIVAGVEAIVESIVGSYVAEPETSAGSFGFWARVGFGVLGALLVYVSASFFLNRKPKTALVTGYFGFVLLLAALGVATGLAMLGVYLALLLTFTLSIRDTAAGESFVRSWNWYVGGSSTASTTSSEDSYDPYFHQTTASVDSSSDDFSGGGGESGGGGASN